MELKNFSFHFLKQYSNDKQKIKYAGVINSPYYEMQVGTSKGGLLRNQSTSIISVHPKNSKIISMIISSNNKKNTEGDFISKNIVLGINSLFQSIGQMDFYNIKNNQNLLMDHLRDLDIKLGLSNDYTLNASLGVIIKGISETLILTIGPATCYIINDNKLNEIETIKPTGIINCKQWLNPNFIVIPNNYESILLTSSVLSEKVISEYADEENVTESIDKMISTHVSAEDVKYSMHKSKNMTIAMYKNSSK